MSVKEIEKYIVFLSLRWNVSLFSVLIMAGQNI